MYSNIHLKQDHMLSNYDIKFNEENRNVLEFWENNKMIHSVCCPPTEFGCDIIGFGEEIHTGYQFNFKGLIIVTDDTFRSIFHEGKLLNKIKKIK